jgi:hypothetical protein
MKVSAIIAGSGALVSSLSQKFYPASIVTKSEHVLTRSQLDEASIGRHHAKAQRGL